MILKILFKILVVLLVAFYIDTMMHAIEVGANNLVPNERAFLFFVTGAGIMGGVYWVVSHITDGTRPKFITDIEAGLEKLDTWINRRNNHK